MAIDGATRIWRGLFVGVVFFASYGAALFLVYFRRNSKGLVGRSSCLSLSVSGPGQTERVFAANVLGDKMLAALVMYCFVSAKNRGLFYAFTARFRLGSEVGCAFCSCVGAGVGAGVVRRGQPRWRPASDVVGRS